MTLTDQLTEYVNAAFTGIWVQTLEPDEAEREILRHARQEKWKVATWDVANGLRVANSSASNGPQTGAGDPLAALRALPGLTRYEAEGAFALSLTRHNAIRPDVIWELKAQTLRKNNLLTLHRGGESFETLGGLANLKDFCRRALQPGKRVRPRGVLLLGVPGTGKSAFCKALGNETGRPTLTLDLGSLMGSLVGATEQNVRQALRIADAISPAILFVDELEKGLSGIGSNGDSGVSTRLFGTLLTWLSDHESDVFFVATANDVIGLQNQGQNEALPRCPIFTLMPIKASPYKGLHQRISAVDRYLRKFATI
jgi:hypothetical protein